MTRIHRPLVLGLLAPIASACGDDALSFEALGPLMGSDGASSFRFGAATAATQIEDNNPHTDWYAFTQPEAEGGLGRGTFVADASRGFERAIEDVALISSMNLDAYRFSVEWARIEPERDTIDEAGLAHYSALLDALVAADIRPNITLHHFSNPVWVDDPRHLDCAGGPSDRNLCGLGHPAGGDLVIEEMAEHARLIASRYGDRVDDWATLNEPVNYLVAGYGVGLFPPGKQHIFDLEEKFIPVVRDYIRAHAAVYKAIKEADTIDADGDGIAANVGLTLSVADWVPAKANRISEDPIDTLARDRLVYVYHHLFVEAIRSGQLDTDLDGTMDEDQPDWRGTLDYLGVQYYFRAGVTGTDGLIPALRLTPCFGDFDFGACVRPLDPTFCVPEMGYEYSPSGLGAVLRDFGSRWPDLPLVVTEGGIATEVGARRAENIVRSLEQIHAAREDGVDVRGYYHWSLLDNFEWAEGYGPRFGLYRVDYETGSRTPTLGVEVLGAIAESRKIDNELRGKYGGDGPMTPEGRVDERCRAEGEDGL